MFGKRFLLTVLCVVVCAALLSACGGAAEEPAGGVGLPNPASVYCQGLGYTEETREEEAGQYGVCIFPDGSECESWDFLGGRCGQEFSFCVQQGGTLREANGIATCVLADGTECAEMEYYQGTCGTK